MRYLSAQYVITNSGPTLKRAVICAEDDGTIVSILENAGGLPQMSSLEFYNGLIIPGFVNCHCHLELSYLQGTIPEGTGLPDFIMKVRSSRDDYQDDGLSYSLAADKRMYDEGIVLCADICNTPLTFELKKKSMIRYLNLLEVFGIDPGKAGKRMDDLAELENEAARTGLPYSIVPHSVYSVSLPLLRLIRERTKKNSVTSIHFMETEAEAMFLADQSGDLRKSYSASGLIAGDIQAPADHVSAILNEVTDSGNLLLVHNTYASGYIVKEILKRDRTFWCLCPGSNLYIEGEMPPVDMLMKEGCEIVTGTDSLASNRQLSILSELKLIHQSFPRVKLDEMIRWATLNGARALGMENHFGKIEPGTKPGLVLLEDLDLINFELLPETSVKRLI